MPGKPIKTIICLALTILASFGAAANVVSSPFISNPDITIERPASGKIRTEPLDWRTDSVLALEIRYSAKATTPAAIVNKTVTGPVLRCYKFKAFVNFTRVSSALCIRFTDANGTELKSVSLSSSELTPGTLTPGYWTEIEAELDLSDGNLPSNADLSSITLQILPQWYNGESVVTDNAPLILISDATLTNTDMQGNYPSHELSNGNMESWQQGSSLQICPEGWEIASVEPVGGSAAYDTGALIAATVSASKSIVLTDNALNPGHIYNRLSFKAYSPSAATVTVTLEGTTLANGKTRTVTETFDRKIRNAWSRISLPITEGAWTKITFTGDRDWVLDDVKFFNEYEDGDIHHPEDILTVTTGADSGEGSLRDIIGRAPAFSVIKFNVEKVELETPLPVGEKSLVIDGCCENGVDTVCIYAPAGKAAFEFNATASGNYLAVQNIKFYGNETKASNGGIIDVPTSRDNIPGRIVFENCKFFNGIASTNGGAVYLNNSGVTSSFINCDFLNCLAANGAAISYVKGSALDVFNCRFNACNTSGSTGGAIAITATDTKADISWSEFTNCISTASSGGAGGVSIQSLSPKVNIVRSLFDFCSGGRGAGISVYNNSRGSVTGEVSIVNCTVMNTAGTSPAVSIASSGSYQAIPTFLVNNILAYNDEVDLVGSANTVGSTNIVTHTEAGLQNTVTINAGDRVFGNYNETTGRPVLTKTENTTLYTVDMDGIAFDAGLKSYQTPAGEEKITDLLTRFTSPDWETVSAQAGHPVISLGHSEFYNRQANVDDVRADSDNIVVWPNPVRTTLNVAGRFEKMWVTSVSGTTVLTGNSGNIDVSRLSPGNYIVSFLIGDKIVSKNIIKY